MVLIKRYANRKLYDTESSRYITLKGVSELLETGKDIQVIDNETGEDITSVVLSQILVDDQKHPRDPSAPIPGHVLQQLVQRGGDALYGMLRRSVDDAQENLQDLRENVRRWVGSPEPADIDASEVSRAVHAAVERVIRMVDLPTRSDLEALNKNLGRLVNALESFDARIQALEEKTPSD